MWPTVMGSVHGLRRPGPTTGIGSRLARRALRTGTRYAAAVTDDGAILLTPLTRILQRELPVWQDDQLRGSVRRGLADAAAGNLRRLDWTS